MSTEPLISGYYGKVSTHGDFVSRGLPVSYTDPWDAWLQEAIYSSQQQLGDEWLNYYLTGPIYRFVLAPGICGESGWLGIMMPSVDRIGRYYPMTISTENRLNINPFVVMQQELPWFDKAETLALSSLADDFNLEHFNNELNELKPVLFDNKEPSISVEQITKQPSQNAWQLAMETKQTMSDILPVFLDNLLKEQCFAYSLWSTQGSEQVSPSLLICEGLPPFDGVAAMLDGNWQKWGWDGTCYPALPFGKQNLDGV